MSSRLDLKLPELTLPAACVVCLSPPAGNYELRRVLSYGRHAAFTVRIPLPMREVHRAAAIQKSRREKLAAALAVLLGLTLGLAASLAVLRFWRASGQGNPILDALAGGILGAGVFVIAWSGLAIWVVPLFAETETRAARRAVRILRYWPKDRIVRLEFENEQLAGMVQAASRGTALGS